MTSAEQMGHPSWTYLLMESAPRARGGRNGRYYENFVVPSKPTMSSREIAELTGKQHKHVMADIQTMCEQLEIQSADFLADYIDSRGRKQPCFELDRYHTEVLVTGYDGAALASALPAKFALPQNGGVGIRVSGRSNHLEDGSFRGLAHLDLKSMW